MTIDRAEVLFQSSSAKGSNKRRRAEKINTGAESSIPKMSEAMDGRRQAHRDVLVAVFGPGYSTPASQRS
tara:strand:+ start:1029 stop:1238 length:210 start_codon:yes stop_codon:yes gene_type:complete